MTRAAHQFIPFSLSEARLFAGKARQANYDLYLASLMNPAHARASLQLLICVMHELQRATRIASEPLIAMIRLTWWREAIEEIVQGATPRAHELVRPLARLLDHQPQIANLLLEITQAHALELEPEQLGEHDAWHCYIQQTYGNLLRCWGEVLHMDGAEGFGQALGLLDIVMRIPDDSARGLIRVSTADCHEAGLDHTANALAQPSNELNQLCMMLATKAKQHLQKKPKKKSLRALQTILVSRANHIIALGGNPRALHRMHAPIALYFSLLRIQITG